ncbi:hypothetical protein D7D25_14180 [Proteiniphilum sp. X52]|nr:hypothetical protein D7D25_14180 [Proteiniphilum sp. X52]
MTCVKMIEFYFRISSYDDARTWADRIQRRLFGPVLREQMGKWQNEINEMRGKFRAPCFEQKYQIYYYRKLLINRRNACSSITRRVQKTFHFRSASVYIGNVYRDGGEQM